MKKCYITKVAPGFYDVFRPGHGFVGWLACQKDGSFEVHADMVDASKIIGTLDTIYAADSKKTLDDMFAANVPFFTKIVADL